MARLSTQLAALEKWLSSAKDLQSPESYQKLREQQFTSLQNHLQEQRLSMEEAAVATQDLASSRHWKDCQKGCTSRGPLSECNIHGEDYAEPRQSCSAPRLRRIPQVFAGHDVGPARGPRRGSTPQGFLVASHLVSLGLRSPTEGTSQAVACLFLQLPGANQ